MSEQQQKPKVEGKRLCKTFRPTKKEHTTKVVGLESHTFDIGAFKYAAKYKKLLEVIANYVQREYKGGPEIATAIRELKMRMLNLPPYLVGTMGSPPDQGGIFFWKQDVQDMKKKLSLLEENKKRTYALVMGQCSPKLESKIQGSTGYKAANKDQDVVALLLIICGHCCQFDDCQQGTWALEQAKHCVSTFYQKYDMTNTDYVEYFNVLVGVVETYGGMYG
jgi:hypothetical protein